MATKSTILFIFALVYLLCYVSALSVGERKSSAVEARHVQKLNPQPEPPGFINEK
ncbi:4882_t:CDS:2 [Paraglomus brasilianum]|uniref:4882_t:CDS:1 n=1 Tax=Paraglomus brasilianum TaxID=144538 RepID=A0A9N9C724_9GLOM|nr:4882_t:CDS:2 [Paraglomus brasilianum]